MWTFVRTARDQELAHLKGDPDMNPHSRLKDIAAAAALGLALAIAPVALSSASASEMAPKVTKSAATRAQMLLGSDVYNAAGERLGEVTDLLIAPDGTVTQAILSVGGFLGIGDKLVAVSYGSLAQRGDRIVFDATKAQLKALPVFHYAEGMAMGERSRYIARHREGVTEWQKRIEAFKHEAGEDAKVTGENLEAAWGTVQAQWQKLETATAAEWSDAKQRFEHALTQLESAWSTATKGATKRSKS
jgi:sporulation protein YlmC with PRC-barrel domain